MGKLAFVFSGQGDQYPGMGQSLAQKYAAARAVFEMCDSVRPGTSQQCFSASADELKNTSNTQPCLFAVETAAAAVLTEAGIMPDAVAGFSLGEVTAAAFAGVFDVKTGFELVCRRGELMQREAERFDTSMAAVVRLTAAQVEEICQRYAQVYPVNYNCPGQISVSGLAQQMKLFFEDVRAAGGRALPIKVKGAFHSPFMDGAARDFVAELEKIELSRPKILLYSNLTACPYGENAVELMARQICSPVRWENIIRNMIADGVDTFIEIGPGKTLVNMIGKIDAGVRTFCTAQIDEILSEASVC